ncbi:MAG TPA: ABC transporter permease [Candidatus Acidoferrum sp.]|nr:ABC transporter permease [Candidatus Acidoferrum sp.]
MRAYLTLTRRELAGFFFSWIGYVVIAGAVFLMGMSFVLLLVKLQLVPTLAPVTELFLRSDFLWLILLFCAPVITMRLFALERSSGTFETLMTTPVSDLAVVLAKFSAALVLFCIAWLPLLGFIVILSYAAHDPTFLDAGTVAATFLGLFLLGTLYMSLGCFASSLTSSQIVAAVIAFAFGLGLYILSYAADRLAADKTWAAATLNYICLRSHMEDFAQGVVDTRCLVFYLTSSAFFLFLTHRVVQSRRWR